jgi:hypothetical protein
MSKFRKKPVVVDAVQWWPPSDERYDAVATPIWNPVPGKVKCGDICVMIGPPDFYTIHTLEGPMRLTPGDWIITGVKGEKYPCKPDIFEATYDPA